MDSRLRTLERVDATAEAGERAVETLLRVIGDDPHRDGLRDTPARVVKALLEMTAGYGESPAEILSTTFAEHSDELIVLRGIDFYSTCEHHLLPFHGVAHVGYLPDDRIIGLSKLARVVELFARRLQVQERMTTQIATILMEELDPQGVGVVLRAEHLCMRMRGVEKQNSSVVTSAMLGTFRSHQETRQEFMTLVNGSGRSR